MPDNTQGPEGLSSSFVLDPPFGEGGIGSVLLNAATDYVDGTDAFNGYVFSPEDGADHELSELEQMLMVDMLNGLFSYDPFWRPLQALIALAARTSAPSEAESRLQADFNDCNAERQRWRDRAEKAEADNARMRAALSPLMPISINETPDYAELTFGEHRTQAMTISPHEWAALNDAFQALSNPVGGEGR